jgi:hypothetical protein
MEGLTLKNEDLSRSLSRAKSYEFNDTQKWMHTVISQLGKNPIDVTTDIATLLHLKSVVAFEQFNESSIRDIIVHVSQFFTNSNLDKDQKFEVVDFICYLLDTCAVEKIGKFVSNFVSLENIAIWCSKQIAMDSHSSHFLSTYFIARYSMFGTHESNVVQQHIKKDIRGIFIQIFEDEIESNVDIRLRLNYLLLFYNLWSTNVTGTNSNLAAKIFESQENILRVLVICAKAIQSGNGGIGKFKLIIYKVIFKSVY